MTRHRSGCAARMLVLGLLLFSSIGPAIAQEHPAPAYDNAVKTNLGATALNLLNGMVSLGVAYERRIDEMFSASVGLAVGSDGTKSAGGVSVGGNLYFAGTAIGGWYGNAGLGLTVASNAFVAVTMYSLGISGGYQWIFPSRFVLRLGAGLTFVQFAGLQPTVVIAPGFAF